MAPVINTEQVCSQNSALLLANLNAVRSDSPAGSPGSDQVSRCRVSSKCSSSTVASDSDRRVTTMMLRNIPNKYTQKTLLQEINDLGFAGTWDFFHLPHDAQNRSNSGYAFINFPDPSDAVRFREVFTEHRFIRHKTRKTASVSTAYVQGLDDNLRHFEHRVPSSGRCEHLQPVVLQGKVKIEFRDAVEAAKERHAAWGAAAAAAAEAKAAAAKAAAAVAAAEAKAEVAAVAARMASAASGGERVQEKVDAWVPKEQPPCAHQPLVKDHPRSPHRAHRLATQPWESRQQQAQHMTTCATKQVQPATPQAQALGPKQQVVASFQSQAVDSYEHVSMPMNYGDAASVAMEPVTVKTQVMVDQSHPIHVGLDRTGISGARVGLEAAIRDLLAGLQSPQADNSNNNGAMGSSMSKMDSDAEKSRHSAPQAMRQPGLGLYRSAWHGAALLPPPGLS